MLCIGVLSSLTPVYAEDNTQRIEQEGFSFEIPAEWKTVDNLYYENEDTKIPRLALTTLKDTSMDVFESNADSFVNGVCEGIGSPIIIIKMHRTSYADIPAMTFSVFGTVEGNDIVMQNDILEISNNQLVAFSYSYQDDNRNFNKILESVILKAEPETEETSVQTEESGKEPTMGEKNALRTAKSYLDILSFSYTGLIRQLTGFEGYSEKEATYAADNCGADWNEQAAKSAKSYLDFMAFSRDGLIQQLTGFEGYTQEQAEYAVSAVGY